ncbi:MAG: hypothetical protein ACK4VV_02060 [Pseudomonas sp.]
MRLSAIALLLAGTLLLVALHKGWQPDLPAYSGWGDKLAAPDASLTRTESGAQVPQRAALTDHRHASQPMSSDSSARQTSFNDANYTPSSQINIIPSVPVNAAPQRVAAVQGQGPRRTAPALVHWRDARGRLTSWQTSYSYQQGVIDNHSLCLTLGPGSIDYRTCRKGAREWLKERCNTSRSIPLGRRTMYCKAHSSYRP